MKKSYFSLLLISIISLCFFSCHDLTLNENTPQETAETVEEGWGIARITFGKKESNPRLLMLPEFTSGEVALTASAAGEEDINAQGSWEDGVSLKLKLNVEYELKLFVQVKNTDSTGYVNVLQWRGSCKLDSAEGKTIQAEPEIVTASGSDTGQLYLNFKYSGSRYCFNIIVDGVSKSKLNDQEASSLTTYLTPGRHEVRFGIIPSGTKSDGSTKITYDDISGWKVFSVYIYPKVVTKSFIYKNEENETVVSTAFDFKAYSSLFEHSNETAVTQTLLIDKEECTDISSNLTQLTGTEIVLTLTQSEPGQNIKAYYGPAGSEEEITPAVTVEPLTNIAVLKYTLILNESGTFYYTVRSVSGIETAQVNIGNFTILAPKEKSVIDEASLAYYLGWSSEADFTTDEKSTYSEMSLESYNIYSPEELQQLAYIVNSGKNCSGVTFILKTKLDLSSIASFTPIGYYNSSSISNRPFKGTFDGNKKVISNLTINRDESYTGLFGYIEAATIQNVILKNADIKGTYYCGGIAGQVHNNSTSFSEEKSYIQYCYFEGAVKGHSYIGGITGNLQQNSVIKYCVIKGNIKGINISSTSYAPELAGGVAGYVYIMSSSKPVEISNCVNYADIETSSNPGGIAGELWIGGNYLTFKYNANFGNVYALSASTYQGGLTSHNGLSSGSDVSATIQYSYNLGRIFINGEESDKYAICGATNSSSGKWVLHSENNYYQAGKTPMDGTQTTFQLQTTKTFDEICGGTYSYDTFKSKMNYKDSDGNATGYFYEYEGVKYPVPVSFE